VTSITEPTSQTNSPSTAPGAAKSPSQTAGPQEEIYQQDGDYIKDIEVNDLRNRYTLTKGSTQKMVNYHFLHLLPLMHTQQKPSLASSKFGLL
jgi:hypothetical protein